jgi:DNA polymerase-3 subunit alpha
LGYKSLALTDHGSCAGLYQFQKACKKKGIKPILGMETYITADHHIKEKITVGSKSIIPPVYHLILLAKNKIGYNNLIYLSSVAYIDGFYYKPRIDFEILKQYKEGLIVTSACCAGEISNLLLNNEDEMAENVVKKYKDVFGDDFYLEIMNHSYFKVAEAQEAKEKLLSNKIYKLSKKLGVKAICTQDTHYARKEDWEAHDVLLAIQTLDNIKNPDRMSFNSDDFYLKSHEQMLDRYKKVPELMTNTVEIANKIDAKNSNVADGLMIVLVLY